MSDRMASLLVTFTGFTMALFGAWELWGVPGVFLVTGLANMIQGSIIATRHDFEAYQRRRGL